MSSVSVPLLLSRDVVDSLTDRLNLLSVLVRDLDPELVFQLHDQLDEVERVGVEILLKRSFRGDLALIDPELLDEHFFHPLVDLLARRCHLALLPAFRFSAPGDGGCYTLRLWGGNPLREPVRQPVDHLPADALGCQSDRVRYRPPGGVAVRDDHESV